MDILKLRYICVFVSFIYGTACVSENTKIGSTLKQVSIGDDGFWGTDETGIVYCVESEEWKRMDGILAQVEVGGSVWGVAPNHQIYFRDGITSEKPCGTSWTQIHGLLKHISVSLNGLVWGVNAIDDIFCRTGITQDNMKGTGWAKLEGSLSQISVGQSGVWGVNFENDVFYRKGTQGNANTAGSEWIKIPERKMVHVSSGYDTVFAVDESGTSYYRAGIGPGSDIGHVWVKIKKRTYSINTQYTIQQILH